MVVNFNDGVIMIKYTFDCPHCKKGLECLVSKESARRMDELMVVCCYCNKSVRVVNKYKVVAIVNEENNKVTRGIISSDEVINLTIDIERSNTVEELLQKV